MRTTNQSQIRLAARLGGLVERVTRDRVARGEFLKGVAEELGADGAILTLTVSDGGVAAWTHSLDDERARRMLGRGIAPPALLAVTLGGVKRLSDLAQEGDPALLELEEGFMNRLGVKHVLYLPVDCGALILCRFPEQDSFADATLAVLDSLGKLLCGAMSRLAGGNDTSSAVLMTLEPEASLSTETAGSLHGSCPVPLVVVDSDVRVVTANPAALRKLDIRGEPPALPPWLAQTVGDRLTELLTAGGIPEGASGDYQFVQPLGRRMMRLGLVPLEPEDGGSRWLLSLEHGGPSLEERMAALVLKYGLKQAELDIVELLVEGLRNARIGEALGIAEATVKYRLGRVMDKTNTTNRADLIATVFSELPTRS